MKLVVQWGRHTPTTVVTAEELDAALDTAAAAGRPQAVDLYDPDRDAPWGQRVLLQIGLGRSDRSFVLFDADSVWAGEPDLPALGEAIWFDYGGTPTEFSPARTRITPATARRAAHEFLSGAGERPTGMQWVTL